MKKKLILLLTSIALVFALTACGGNTAEDPTTEPNDAGQVSETDTNVESTDTEETEGAAAGEFSAEEPILLTTVGQSADVEMIKAMLDNAGLDYEMDNLAQGDSLGDAKTLILAVGGSSKGLGAAGIDENAEIDRVQGLIEEAKSNGAQIIAMHIGGEARRGDLSDAFIQPSFEAADYGIVVAEGDSDNMMQDIASANGYEINLIDSMADVTAAIEEVFN